MNIERQLQLLRSERDKKHIPFRDRNWFWTTFQKLKGSGWRFDKAWDFTVWALEKHYGLC